MKIFALFAAFFFTLHAYSYDEKGYYITNSGERIEGFFEADEIYTNYHDLGAIGFKRAREDNYSHLSPDDIKEYGIGMQYKFRKHTVLIDMSGTSAGDVNGKNPKWEEKTVFLSIVLEGAATLYSYTANYNTKFFFSLAANPAQVDQLVYKKYMSANGTEAENTFFRQQLLNNITCEGQSADDFLNIRYEKADLVNVFKKYSECKNVDYTLYTEGPVDKRGVRFTVFAGYYLLNFGIGNSATPTDKSGTDFGFGAEAAYVVPSGKSEFFLRLEYEVMSGSTAEIVNTGFNNIANTYDLDAKVLDVYFGARYNLILNRRNKFFVDGALGLCFPSGSVVKTSVYTTDTNVTYPGETRIFELTPNFCGNVGIGYVMNDKYGISLRYETRRDFFDSTGTAYTTELSRIGVNLRYTIT